MRIALVMIMLLALVGCGSPATTGTTATTPAPTTAPAPTSVPAAMTAPAATLPAGSVEAKALEILATQLGTQAATLQLTGKEAKDWPDPSLGCPKRGVMYAAVITPGFKLTFSDGSKTYDVRTDENGTRAVLCDNGQPTQLGSS
jgi:hypothetical protein